MRPDVKISQSDIITLRKWLWELRFRPPRFLPLPGSLVWAPGTPLNTPWAFGHSLTIDQEIWLMGSEIQKYNHSTAQWTTEPSPFTYCEQTFCLAANKKIYAISGFQSCWSCTSYVEEFDPYTGVLVPKAPIPLPCIESAVAATPDGKIYVCGGCVPVSDGSRAGTYLDTLQVYDTQADAWTVKKSMYTQRSSLRAVAASDGNVYAIGGMLYGGKVTDVIEAYQPSTDTWNVKTPMPRKKAHFAAVLIEGSNIYCIGGYTPEMRPDVWSSVDVYDCANDVWTSATSLAQGRWGLAASVLPTNEIYALGGLLASWASGTGSAVSFDLVDVGTFT